RQAQPAWGQFFGVAFRSNTKPVTAASAVGTRLQSATPIAPLATNHSPTSGQFPVNVVSATKPTTRTMSAAKNTYRPCARHLPYTDAVAAPTKKKKRNTSRNNTNCSNGLSVLK